MNNRAMRFRFPQGMILHVRRRSTFGGGSRETDPAHLVFFRMSRLGNRIVVASSLLQPLQKLWDNLQSPAMIVEEGAPQRLAIIGLDRGDNFACFLFDGIEQQRLEALDRLEAVGDVLERKDMLGIARRFRQGKEKRPLPVLGPVILCDPQRIEAWFGATVEYRKQEQVVVPRVEVAKRVLCQDRHPETFVQESFDEALPGQAMECIAYRRDAGVELL